jgi:HK97 family phage major capsid protein
MASSNIAASNAWVPEETDSRVIQVLNATSAVESLATPVPMGTDTRSIPRDYVIGDSEVIDRGGSYGTDTTGVGDITLSAKKFGKILSFYDEDLQDSPLSIIDRRQTSWARSFGIQFDNATLGTTADASTASGGKFLVPFRSLVYQLITADSNTSYSASGNYSVSGTGGPTYSQLSSLVGKLETSNFFDESKCRFVAHPGEKEKLRGLLDAQNRPLFVENVREGSPDTILGYPVRWSLGARTSGVATSAPTGRRLILFGNWDYAYRGIRSGPESMPIDMNGGDTDEAKVKIRARRGWGIGYQQAFACLEDQSA